MLAYYSVTTENFSELQIRGIFRIIERQFSYFSLKLYVVTPHLNRLDEMVQMRGRNIIYFYAEITKNIPSYHQILPLI